MCVCGGVGGGGGGGGSRNYISQRLLMVTPGAVFSLCESWLKLTIVLGLDDSEHSVD